MHFFIDKDNRVSRFHMEAWDSLSLGSELVNKINDYNGKKFDTFLKFVLEKRLFLRLRVLFMMGNNKTVYFWAISSCNELGQVKEFIRATKEIVVKNSRFAEIHLKMKGKDDKIIPILVEDILSSVYTKFGYPREVITLEMTPKDAIETAIEFNISRNRQYILRSLVRGIKGKFGIQHLKGIKFVGIKKNQVMEILEDEFIANLSKKDVNKYLALIPTMANTEKEKIELSITLNKIKNIIES